MSPRPRTVPGPKGTRKPIGIGRVDVTESLQQAYERREAAIARFHAKQRARRERLNGAK